MMRTCNVITFTLVLLFLCLARVQATNLWISNCSSLSSLYSYSGDISIDSSNPQNFHNFVNRFYRTQQFSALSFVTWKLPKCGGTILVDTLVYTNYPSFSYEISFDGINYQTIPPIRSLPLPSISGWALVRDRLSPPIAIESQSACFLRIIFPSIQTSKMLSDLPYWFQGQEIAQVIFTDFVNECSFYCWGLEYPNPTVGVGYLYSDPSCLTLGGAGCVAMTGCRLCHLQGSVDLKDPTPLCPQCVYEHHDIPYPQSPTYSSPTSSPTPSGNGIKPLSISQPTFPSFEHSLKRTTVMRNFSPPVPTNAWWINAVMPVDGLGFQTFTLLPYQVKVTSQGVSVAFPDNIVQPQHVINNWSADFVTFSSTQPTTDMFLNQNDTGDLFITMTWATGVGNFYSPMVRGSPYFTMIYRGQTPVLTFSSQIRSINGNLPYGTYSGNRFVLYLQSGKTWVVYTSQTVMVEWQGKIITFSQPFSGFVRWAHVPNNGVQSILDTYYQTYPVSGSFAYNVDGDTAMIEFSWNQIGPGSILMLALPHHIDAFLNPKIVLPNAYSSIKGPMSAVVGNSWLIKEVLPTIDWYAPNGIDPAYQASVVDALTRDQNVMPLSADSYSFGKEVAKMGRLAVIADELGETQIANSVRNNLKQVLEPWLDGTNSDPLRWETYWGGVCTLIGLQNSGADYGNGWFNDHHFHWGYHLYAYAAIAKEDPAWASTHMDSILDMVRDIANPSTDDPFFPVTRHKDWFLGHSWASGLFIFADSKNQESSSEAVNCYYAVYLIGKALGRIDIQNVGRILLATEIRSVKKYWHILQPSAVYPPMFAQNTIVGMVWSDKADWATWFGLEVQYVHCINMLPFTPISEILLDQEWVSQEYPVLATSLTTPITDPWKGFVIMDRAIIDKDGAWAMIDSLNTYDNGNSETNTRYWVATRP